MPSCESIKMSDNTGNFFVTVTAFSTISCSVALRPALGIKGLGVPEPLAIFADE